MRLDYIIFLHGKPGESLSPPTWSYTTDSGRNTVTYLMIPGEPKEELPTDTQIFEYRSHELTRYPDRITYAQLEAFMRQKDVVWSAESLIEFAERHEE